METWTEDRENTDTQEEKLKDMIHTEGEGTRKSLTHMETETRTVFTQEKERQEVRMNLLEDQYPMSKTSEMKHRQPGERRRGPKTADGAEKTLC